VDIKTRIEPGLAVIELSGAVTFGVSEGLIETINRLLDQGHRQIVVDLESVRFLDSAGMGAIVQAYTTVSRRAGVLWLAGNRHLIDLFGPTIKRPTT
jgi:anti-sigma B factor antagonist